MNTEVHWLVLVVYALVLYFIRAYFKHQFGVKTDSLLVAALVFWGYVFTGLEGALMGAGIAIVEIITLKSKSGRVYKN